MSKKYYDNYNNGFQGMYNDNLYDATAFLAHEQGRKDRERKKKTSSSASVFTKKSSKVTRSPAKNEEYTEVNISRNTCALGIAAIVGAVGGLTTGDISLGVASAVTGYIGTYVISSALNVTKNLFTTTKGAFALAAGVGTAAFLRFGTEMTTDDIPAITLLSTSATIATYLGGVAIEFIINNIKPIMIAGTAGTALYGGHYIYKNYIQDNEQAIVEPQKERKELPIPQNINGSFNAYVTSDKPLIIYKGAAEVLDQIGFIEPGNCLEIKNSYEINNETWVGVPGADLSKRSPYKEGFVKLEHISPIPKGYVCP